MCARRLVVASGAVERAAPGSTHQVGLLGAPARSANMRLMAIETAEAATGSEIRHSPARPRRVLLARIMLGIFIVGNLGNFVIAFLDSNLTAVRS